MVPRFSIEPARYHQLRCHSKLALVNSSFGHFGGAQRIFSLELLGLSPPLYLRVGVFLVVLDSLRAENVIAMSWPQGLSLRLETADGDYQSGCKD